MSADSRRQAPLDYVPSIGDTSCDKRGMGAVFLACALLYAVGYRLDVSGAGPSPAAREMAVVEETLFRATEALLRGIEARLWARSGDETRRALSPESPGAVLVHAPFYAAGWLMDGARQGTGRRAARAADVLVMALVAAFVYRLGRVLGAGPLGATAAALVTGAGTTLWPCALWATPQPTSALGVVAAATGAVSYRRFPRMQSLATTAVGLTLAVLARPANTLLAPIFLVYVFADKPRRLLPQVRRMPAIILPVACAVAWTVWQGHGRPGGWLDAGSGAGRFTFPLGRSVPGLLVGAGTGLMRFNPPVILGLGVVGWLLVGWLRQAVWHSRPREPSPSQGDRQVRAGLRVGRPASGMAVPLRPPRTRRVPPAGRGIERPRGRGRHNAHLRMRPPGRAGGPREGALLLGVSGALYLIAASREGWAVGQGWGPLLLVEVVPLLGAPLALVLTPRRRSWPAWLAAAGLAAVGAAVQAPAVLSRTAQGRPATWWQAWPAAGLLAAVMALAAGWTALRLARRYDRQTGRG